MVGCSSDRSAASLVTSPARPTANTFLRPRSVLAAESFEQQLANETHRLDCNPRFLEGDGGRKRTAMTGPLLVSESIDRAGGFKEPALHGGLRGLTHGLRVRRRHEPHGDECLT